MRLYIAGPYSSQSRDLVTLNIQTAANLAARLWDMGHQCFTPHLNTAHFEDLTIAPETLYLDFGLYMLRHMEGIVLLPTYNTSKGAIKEKEVAEELGLRIFYWPRDKERLEHLGENNEDLATQTI